MEYEVGPVRLLRGFVMKLSRSTGGWVRCVSAELRSAAFFRRARSFGTDNFVIIYLLEIKDY